MTTPSSIVLRAIICFCVADCLREVGAATGTASRHHLRHNRHHATHRVHGMRAHGHLAHEQSRGIRLDEDKMSLDEALASVPASVGDAFASFQQTQSQGAATTVLEQLNQVYERSLTEKDSLQQECEDRQENATFEVRNARSGLMNVETQLTQMQDHLQSLQTGIDRSLAEVEALRLQHEQHSALCARGRDRQFAASASAATDNSTATALVTQVTASCSSAGGTAPVLVQCNLADGETMTTFQDAAVRTVVASLSNDAAQLVGLNLDRAVRSTHAASALLLVEVARRDHRRALRRKHRRHSRGHADTLLHQMLEKATLPTDVCTVVNPPPCQSFADSMATFGGNVQDLVDELRQRAREEDDHCTLSLASYDTQVKELKRQADDSNVALANAVSEKTAMDAQRREKRAMFVDVKKEVDEDLHECRQRLSDLDESMCGAKKVRSELGTSGTGAFLGDCDVTDWIHGACSTPCGQGGVKDLTREIVHAPQSDPKCPALLMSKSCNVKPCPVDARMGRWGPWSECSRACGGGLRLRHRRVTREAAYGGMPAAETVQEQLCNINPCDQDCGLSDWKEWSGCSKACAGGHQARVRHVVRPISGGGSCPGALDEDRMHTRACNSHACIAATMKCNSLRDIVLVVDASGSGGEAGFGHAKAFGTMLVNRVTFNEATGAKMGLVSFGSDATEVQPMTINTAMLLQKLPAMTWQGTNTNTAEGLSLSREMLDHGGRAGAKSVVVLVTDGMPTSALLADTMFSRLKSEGVRVVFVAIGQGLSRSAVEKWASWPAAENIVVVPSFAKLTEEKVTELLADICPVLL